MDSKSSDKLILTRKKAFNSWIKKPSNFTLVAILVLAFVIRLYHFGITLNQPIWWDESEYMAGAKKFAFGIPYEINQQRAPTFQFIISLFLSVGFGENFIKFVMVIIPSLFLVYAVYLLGKEMFDEKIALVGSFLTATSWTLLFWTSRFQPDYISMSFQILAIYFMWRFWKRDTSKDIILSAVFSGLSFHFKVSGLLVPLIFMIFIFMKEGLSAFKNKKYYLYSIVFLITLSPLFIWNYTQYGDPLATRTNYSPILETDAPFALNQNLQFYYMLTGGLYFVVFIIGILVCLEFLLYLDIMVLKERKRVFDPKIFSLLVLLVVSLFYAYWIKETQDRWVFLWIPFIGFITARGLIKTLEVIIKTKKKESLIRIAVIILLLGYIGYSQVTHANDIVKVKLGSYGPVKMAGEWIKENSEEGEVILSRSQPQISYYSERRVVNYGGDFFTTKGAKEFDELISELKPKFVMVSIFEKHPPWVSDWIGSTIHNLTVANAYGDPQTNQATAVIYKVTY